MVRQAIVTPVNASISTPVLAKVLTEQISLNDGIKETIEWINFNWKIIKNIASFLNYSLRNLRAERKMKNTNEYRIKTTVKQSYA